MCIRDRFKVKGEKRYMVFFKAPDADAMTAAFKEYTAKPVRKAERPSVLEKLQHFKSLIQAAVVEDVYKRQVPEIISNLSSACCLRV